MIFSVSAIGCSLFLAFFISLNAGSAVGARAGLGLGDFHVPVFDARRIVAVVIGQGVLKVVGVVALLESVESLVRAARLLTVYRRVDYRLCNLEQIAELDAEQPLGVV